MAAVFDTHVYITRYELENHIYATYSPKERKRMEMKSSTDQNLVCEDSLNVTIKMTAVKLGK